ncbi:uncharacterized protein LOC110253904 [Exaiptasia diaphana]|uniref:Uncharacterized protein n=1 Tax=Exaiptasia diaphana TaxID=2652724 RepID=A0A913YA07_EXADI|nr:uncharacterized protein LOC110253904 [Exaiptasia diaphana]
MPGDEVNQESEVQGELDEKSRDHINKLKDTGHLIAADVELQSDCDKINQHMKAPFDTFDAVSYKVKRVPVIKEFYIVKVFTGNRKRPQANDYRFAYIVKEDGEPFDATIPKTWQFNKKAKLEKDILE